MTEAGSRFPVFVLYQQSQFQKYCKYRKSMIQWFYERNGGVTYEKKTYISNEYIICINI